MVVSKSKPKRGTGSVARVSAGGTFRWHLMVVMGNTYSCWRARLASVPTSNSRGVERLARRRAAARREEHGRCGPQLVSGEGCEDAAKADV